MQAASSPTPSVVLVASRQPQTELQVFVQLFGQLGFTPEQPKGGAPAAKWRLKEASGGSVEIALIQEIGMFRLVLWGQSALMGGNALSSYLPILNFDSIVPQMDQASGASEQRLYAMLAVLALPNGDVAMQRIGSTLLAEGPDAVREGVVTGLTMLETPDVGMHLEAIARRFPGSPAGSAASKSLESLVERGIVTKSVDKLLEQAEALTDTAPQRALELLGEVAGAGHRSLRASVIESRAHRALGALEQAEHCLDVITDVDVAGSEVAYAAEAWIERATTREQLGRLDEARADAERAVALAPNNDSARALHERLSLALDQSDESASEKLVRLNTAIEARPKDAALRLQRAEVLVASGEFTAALADLRHAQEIDANDKRIAVLQSEAELGAKHFGAALRSATVAARQAPTQFKRRAATLRGRAYLALDEMRRAASAFAEARRAEPTFHETWLGSGLALEQLGKADDALAAYEQALAQTSPAELVARLQPTLYGDAAQWTEVAKVPIAVSSRPERKLGLEPVDTLFKRCLGCGALTLARRTSCKECGEREFVS